MNKDLNNLKNKNYHNKKQNIIPMIVIFVLLVCSIAFLFFFISSLHDDKKGGVENNSSNETEKNNNQLTELEKKLEELDNIDKKISFFKDDYIDRYIAYKNSHPDLSIEKVIVYVNIGLDQDFYSSISPSPNQDTHTVLTNKFYSLAEDYVPKNLETIDTSFASGNKLMEKDAKIAFEQMAKDAQSEGYHIRAVSTYRSYDYQSRLYSNYAKADGTDKADTYSARAGSSEHQTGLAVDVDNVTLSYTSFGNTKEFEWMQENAYKYGFILRYTKEFEFITGYQEEPWHYRYVGVDIASYIQNNPMTYEEYFVRFLDK